MELIESTLSETLRKRSKTHPNRLDARGIKAYSFEAYSKEGTKVQFLAGAELLLS